MLLEFFFYIYRKCKNGVSNHISVFGLCLLHKQWRRKSEKDTPIFSIVFFFFARIFFFSTQSRIYSCMRKMQKTKLIKLLISEYLFVFAFKIDSVLKVSWWFLFFPFIQKYSKSNIIFPFLSNRKYSFWENQCPINKYSYIFISDESTTVFHSQRILPNINSQWTTNYSHGT